MLPVGIVTFNPDISRLWDNVKAIRPQVAEIVIFDNGSTNISEIEAEAGKGCTVIKSPKNVGIARALNEICRYYKAKGYEWVLTLDDDSVCPENLMEEYCKFLSLENIGILSPRIFDRAIGDIDEISYDDYSEVDACITSASLLNLCAWENVGGFWDDLFIDMVDFDICWSLKEKGYRVVRVNSVSLLHELGHSSIAVFRGNNVAVLNHSPQRYYYIFRNTIAVGRKNHRRYQCFRWNMKRLFLICRFESNKAQKIKAASIGVFDGLFNRLGEKQNKFR